MTPEQFMANFSRIAEAPGGLNGLRGQMLSLALSGQLAEAEETDASELISTMVAEVEALKSTRHKSKPGSSDDYPPMLSVPQHWGCVRLGDVSEIMRGVSYRKSDASDTPEDGRIALLRANNINKTINFEKLVYVPLTLVKDLQRLRAGDVVVATSSGSKDLVGKAALVTEDFEVSFGAFCGLIRISRHMNSGFIRWFFQSPTYRLAISSASRGIGINNLRKGDLEGIPLPVPPLAEQKRIVAKVDQLMAMLDDLEQRQEKKRSAAIHVSKASLDSLVNAEDPDQLARAWERVSKNFGVVAGAPEGINRLRDTSLFLGMSGVFDIGSVQESSSRAIARASQRLTEIQVQTKARRRSEVSPHVPEADQLCKAPKTWSWTRLGIISQITGGVTKGRSLSKRQTRVLPYLRVANVQRWKLDLTLVKEIEVPRDEVDKYSLAPSDVVLTEGGDWDKLGRAAIWRGELATCVHQNHVFRVRSADHEILSEWIEAWCNFEAGRKYFQSCSKQTTNLASINMTQLRNLPIAIPPLSTQDKILRQWKKFSALIDQLEDRSTRLQQVASKLAIAATRAS